jgi:hypothetical protein
MNGGIGWMDAQLSFGIYSFAIFAFFVVDAIARCLAVSPWAG